MSNANLFIHYLFQQIRKKFNVRQHKQQLSAGFRSLMRTARHLGI